MDRHELEALAEEVTEDGEPVFDREMVARLTAELDELAEEKRRSAGHSKEATSVRKPIQLEEYLCTLLDLDGRAVQRNVLCLVANRKYLVRGPEPNPFKHGTDWIVYAPAVSVPTSVYGRSYMETWSSIAKTFVAMTNVIVDSAFLASMKAFAVVEDMLEDPTELEEGIFPTKLFRLETGSDARMFLQPIELGQLSGSAVTVWTALKQELREGAQFNEIALGQVPPKGDITATEIAETQQGSVAMMRSIARTIESQLLEPILNLIWKTGLQHLDPEDGELRDALGSEMFGAFLTRSDELAKRRFTFRARGISGLIDRQQKLRALLQSIQILAQNPQLASLTFAKISPDRLIDRILELSGIDLKPLKPTAREEFLRRMSETMRQAQPEAAVKPPAGMEGGPLGPQGA